MSDSPDEDATKSVRFQLPEDDSQDEEDDDDDDDEDDNDDVSQLASYLLIAH